MIGSLGASGIRIALPEDVVVHTTHVIAHLTKSPDILGHLGIGNEVLGVECLCRLVLKNVQATLTLDDCVDVSNERAPAELSRRIRDTNLYLQLTGYWSEIIVGGDLFEVVLEHLTTHERILVKTLRVTTCGENLRSRLSDLVVVHGHSHRSTNVNVLVVVLERVELCEGLVDERAQHQCGSLVVRSQLVDVTILVLTRATPEASETTVAYGNH